MRVVILRGSPKRGGSSDTIADSLLKGLKKTGPIEVFDFILNDMAIRPCQGCESCMTTKDHKCVIDDDMYQIYSVFADADVVVWATPMYWGYMTAQMKIALDRMEALAMDVKKYWLDKEFIAVLTYRHHYESTVGFFERVQDYFRFKLNFLTFCSMDKETREDFHVSTKPEMLEEAYQLGIKIGTNLASG
ncbi:MAG: flavodoxin family protein [Candidatus Thorarchaeota archaeon]